MKIFYVMFFKTKPFGHITEKNPENCHSREIRRPLRTSTCVKFPEIYLTSSQWEQKHFYSCIVNIVHSNRYFAGWDDKLILCSIVKIVNINSKKFYQLKRDIHYYT